MPTLGETFRSTRESRHETVDDTARVLKIRRAMLSALEQGRYEELPGGAINVGFVRTYARHLGLDPEQALLWYREETGAQPTATKLTFHTPPEPARRPGAGALFTGLMIGLLAIGGWVTYANQDVISLPQVSEVPDRLRTLFGQNPDPAVPVSGLENEHTGKAEPTDDAASVADHAASKEPSAEVVVTALPATRSVSGGAAAAVPGPGSAGYPSGDDRIAAVLPPLTAANLKTDVERQVQDAIEEQALEEETQPEPLAAESEPAQTVVVQPAAEVEPQAAEETALSEPEPSTASDDSDARELAAAQRAGRTMTSSPSGNTAVNVTVVQAVPQRIVQGTTTLTPITASEAPSSATATSPTGSLTVAAGSGNRVIVLAVNDAWVQVKDGAGNVLFSRVLKADETYRPPNKAGIRMVTGSAGALRLTVDGETLPLLGRPGTVVRGVPLEPNKLKQWISRQR